jgi:threonine/homoserine/homoserine lactone efflux protein
MATIIAMILFSLSMSITPGPVNIIALSSGVNHGFTKAMVFVSGATIGFTLLLLCVGLGIGAVIINSEYTMKLLAVCGSLFIAYMGYTITRMKKSLKLADKSSTSFFYGFILQWLNPKAWIACVSGISAFNTTSLELLLLFVSIYFSICYFSIASWAYAGKNIGRLLENEFQRKIFNITLGGSLMLVAIYLLYIQLTH